MYLGRYGIMYDADDLYYVRARYYNPIVQRYLSPDILTGKITDPQSLNPYVYCEGNPVIFIDPTGYWAWLNNFTNGIAVSADNNLLFGAAKAVTGNDLESDTIAYKAGKIVGDVGSGVTGIITTAAGVAGEAGGIVLDSTGVGAIAGVPVNIASAGAISYGVKVTVNSGRYLAQDVKDLFVNANDEGAGNVKSRQLGKEGENAAGIINAKEKRPSLSGTAKYRVPDEWI